MMGSRVDPTFSKRGMFRNVCFGLSSQNLQNNPYKVLWSSVARECGRSGARRSTLGGNPGGVESDESGLRPD